MGTNRSRRELRGDLAMKVIQPWLGILPSANQIGRCRAFSLRVLTGRSRGPTIVERAIILHSMGADHNKEGARGKGTLRSSQLESIGCGH